MRTANPALSDKVFTIEGTHENVMTVQGTVFKTAALLLLVVLGGGFTWTQAAVNPQLAQGYTLGGLFVGLILALILDFDFIEKGAAQGAPKYMEWYGAFGLLVTLVWLYIEILRLLSKLRGSD